MRTYVNVALIITARC